MTQKTFHDFWGKWSSEWYSKAKIKLNGNDIPVSELCEFKPNAEHVLNQHYQLIKQIVKDSYFKDTKKRLSRYKRAAVVAYAINGASPLIYKDSTIQEDMDPNFLKQRLAFYIALGSIIQDYTEEQVRAFRGSIFYFDELGKRDILDGEDDFLQSVYKDLFYADVYENYNVLTMANVFGLLVERASQLGTLTPIESRKAN